MNLASAVTSLPIMTLPSVEVMEIFPVTVLLTVMFPTSTRLLAIEIVVDIPTASFMIETVPPSSSVAGCIKVMKK